MFYSSIQTQVLVLAFCSLVLAGQRADQGNGLGGAAQQPMLTFRPSVSQKTMLKPMGGNTSQARNATINLFPPSPIAMRTAFSFGCKESQVNTITLSTDVCLSGDYYLNHNMLIAEAPLCPDGQTPTMSYYPARGCVGVTQFESTTKPIPEYCLWGGLAPKYWSLIFRCDPDATSAQDADRHQVAIPPPARKPLPYKGIVRPDGPYDAIMVSHSSCSNHHLTGVWNGARETNVPVDHCVATAGKSINIKSAAICENGTRAQWARFEDSTCNHGRISTKYGLVDIHDTDVRVDKCLLTGNDGSKDKVRSMAFWCDGIKFDSPTQEKKPTQHPESFNTALPPLVQVRKTRGSVVMLVISIVAAVVVLVGIWVWFGTLVPSKIKA